MMVELSMATACILFVLTEPAIVGVLLYPGSKILFRFHCIAFRSRKSAIIRGIHHYHIYNISTRTTL